MLCRLDNTRQVQRESALPAGTGNSEEAKNLRNDSGMESIHQPKDQGESSSKVVPRDRPACFIVSLITLNDILVRYAYLAARPSSVDLDS